MNTLKKLSILVLLPLVISSCVSNKDFAAMQSSLQSEKELLASQLNACNSEKRQINDDLIACQSKLSLKNEQITDLRDQIADVKSLRDKQLTQVGDLTALSQSANDNIKQTLSQLETKDKYIHLLQAARTKADSINLALAVNLKTVLKDGIEDEDVDIKVDKTVVFINLSDKMLYQSGSYKLTSRAYEVLDKIAKIVESRPDLEVMVEGYTDNVPIKSKCVDDNWDLSVLRSTAVVRTLQHNYGIDPNRLIAAGRGEYNTLADNETEEGRSTNRRTRIIILPKLNQFYDLLNPNKVPE